jgi:hypothetical protein
LNVGRGQWRLVSARHHALSRFDLLITKEVCINYQYGKSFALVKIG